MSKNTRDPEQVYRLDGRNVFCEVMVSGLGIDKVLINFVEYDTSNQKGQRIKNRIGFYMPMFSAKRLSIDILSGRIAAMGKISRKNAKEAGKKYADIVYEQLGGTPSIYAANNVPIARSMTIGPGSAQPWVLTATQGPGHETKEGLIVMDKCEQVVRIPMTSDKLKELAIAIDTTYNVWVQLRFVPIVAPMMHAANEERKQAVDAAKAASALDAQAKRSG